MAESNNNPSVPTVGVDTSAWNIPGAVSTHVDVSQPQNMFTPEPQMTAVTNRSVEVNAFIGSMRYDAQSGISKKEDPNKNWLKMMDPNQGKIKLETQVALSETHELMNDDETWLPKYKSYMIGVDNESRLASQQSSGEKVLNVFKRLGSNTSKGALDIGSFVYGVGAMAMTGRFDALYDNGMSKYVDDLTAKTNFEYKNYYDAETKKKGLGLDIQTLDKVMGGAEFTARMLASEAIIATATGGASLPGSMARAGLKAGVLGSKLAKITKVADVGRGISRMMDIATLPERMVAQGGNIARASDKFTDALKMATKRGAMGEMLVQSRFALTSPMYESGFEAMHFRKEAEKNFQQYYKELGTEPTVEQVNAFSTKLAGASDAVFITNMALLSVSNMALFGDMLSIKNPLSKSIYSPSNFMKKSVFGIGTERSAATGLNQAVKASLWNKSAAYISPFVKGALIEGVYEEGSQGIASGTLKNYVASAYDEKAMKETANYVDSFGKAFQDQWGTKEGREEVLIGALIGGLFGGVGGVRQATNEYKQQAGIADLQNVGEEFVENFKSNVYTNEQLLTLFSGQSRFQNLRSQVEDAQDKGDKLKEASGKAQSFISLLDSYHTVGKETEFTKMFGSMMQGLDNQTIADSTGLDISEIDAFKKEQSDSMQEIADKYSTARKAAEYMFKPNMGGFVEQEIEGKKVRVNSQNLVSSFAFASTMSFFNEKYAGESFAAFQEKLAQVNTSPEIVEKMTALGALKSAHRVEQQKYEELASQQSKLNLDMGRVSRQLNTLDKGDAKTNNAGRRVELAEELTSIQNNLRSVGDKKDALWKTLVDDFYAKMGKTGSASQLDLNKFTEQVQDIQDSLDSLNIQETDKIILEKLLEQFNESNDAYKDFTKLTTSLADPRFTYKTFKGILGGTRAKLDKSLNEHSQETLMKIYGYSETNKKSLADTYQENQPNTLDEAKLKEDYEITQDDLEMIKNKLNSGRKLSGNEEKFYNQNKKEIDSYKTADKQDPLNSVSPATKIDSLSIAKIAKETELSNFDNQVYSDELQKKLDQINQDLETIQDEIDELTYGDIQVDEAKNEAILNIENEIRELEVENIIDEPRVRRTQETQKNTYRQYEYAKPNGDKIIGYLEVDKGILQLVNETEIVDIRETDSNLETLDTRDIEGLTEMQDEVILGVNEKGDLEIYANGNIYKLPRAAKTLDDAIFKDKNGNYQVEVKAGNGKIIILKGSAADAVVYENLINKIEQDATDEQINRYREQAEADIRLEKKYAELITKTANRDSEQKRLKKEQQKEKRSKGREFDSKIDQKVKLVQNERTKLLRELDITNSEYTQENDKIRMVDRIQELKNELLLDFQDETLETQEEVLDQMVEQEQEDQIDQPLTNQDMRRIELGSVHKKDIIERLMYKSDGNNYAFTMGGTNYFTTTSENAEYQINKYYDELENNDVSQDSTSDEIQEEPIVETASLTDDERKVKIRTLLFLENELKLMDEVKTEFNPEGTPIEQLTWIVENIQDLSFESVEGLNTVEVPQQEEVDEYLDLLNKTNRNSAQKKRISELRDKFIPFNLMDALDLEGSNILDILNLYNQSKNIQEIQENQEGVQNEEDFQTTNEIVRQTGEGKKGEYRSPKVGLIYDGVYIEKQNTMNKLFHVKLFSLLSKSLEKGNTPKIIVYKDSSKPTQEIIEEIMVTQDNLAEISEMFDSTDNIKINLEEDGLYLKKPKGEKSFHIYNGDVLNLLDSVAYEITGQNTGYIALYEPKVDGTFGSKESEFKVRRNNIEIPFDKEVLNSIKSGDKVTLEYDPMDNYNKTLLPNERASKGNIYVKKNNKLVQILKASDVEGKVKGEGWEELAELRVKVLESKTPLTITVEKSYIGLPQISLDSEGKPREIEVDPKNIIGYGYIDTDGSIKGDIVEDQADNLQYIEPLRTRKKVSPIMAFKAYGQVILFPVNLKLKGVNLTADVDAVMTDSSKTQEQKMFEVNAILEQNNLFTPELAMSNANTDVGAVKSALSDVQSQIDMTDPNQVKDADKYSYIDLNDPFMSSKLVFNLKPLEKISLEVGKVTREYFKVNVTSKDGIGSSESESKIC